MLRLIISILTSRMFPADVVLTFPSCSSLELSGTMSGVTLLAQWSWPWTWIFEDLGIDSWNNDSSMKCWNDSSIVHPNWMLPQRQKTKETWYFGRPPQLERLDSWICFAYPSWFDPHVSAALQRILEIMSILSRSDSLFQFACFFLEQRCTLIVTAGGTLISPANRCLHAHWNPTFKPGTTMFERQNNGGTATTST